MAAKINGQSILLIHCNKPIVLGPQAVGSNCGGSSSRVYIRSHSQAKLFSVDWALLFSPLLRGGRHLKGCSEKRNREGIGSCYEFTVLALFLRLLCTCLALLTLMPCKFGMALS